MTEIFLVVREDNDPERPEPEPVRAFATEAEAVAFRDAINAFMAAAPQVDRRADGMAWVDSLRARRAYLKTCAFAELAEYGTYEITTLPFGPPT